MPLAAAPSFASSPDLTNRDLVFLMGMAPEGLRAPLGREFKRRFLPDTLGRLSCLELVAAFVGYPLDVCGDR